MRFDIDLGTYEQGRIARVWAQTPRQAYKKGLAKLDVLLRNGKFDNHPEKDWVHVVQIYDKYGRCYYDYMNGFSIYLDPDERVDFIKENGDDGVEIDLMGIVFEADALDIQEHFNVREGSHGI